MGWFVLAGTGALLVFAPATGVVLIAADVASALLEALVLMRIWRHVLARTTPRVPES